MKREGLLNKIKEAVPYSMLLCFTFFVFGPIQLYLSNHSEFWFKLRHILPMVIISFLVTFISVTLILIFISQKIKKYISAGVFGLGFALYLQGNFINYDYGVLDGTEIDWGSYGMLGTLNTFIWVLCIFVPVILAHFLPKQLKKATTWISLFIIGIQVITVGTLFITTDLTRSSQIAVTEEGMLSLSEEKNLVVFVLDTFDAGYMNEILENRPEYKELLEDFTYFDNALGIYPKTKGAIPHILTGERYDNTIPYFDYLDKAYKKTIFFNNLFAEGYDAGAYISTTFLPSNADDYFMNIINAEKKPSSKINLGLMMYKATAFTYFPHAFKDNLWFYSGDFDKYADTIDEEGKNNLLVKDDIIFYNKLLTNGLSFDNKSYAFRFYHLSGAHPPYRMTEDIQYSKDYTSPIQESLASINIVLKYIELLKNTNVYDNTSIVILADHGNIGFSQNPVLMIKQAGISKAFSISSAPISYDDILNTFLYLATGDFDKYQPNVYTWKEGDYRERSYWFFFWDDSMKKEFLPNMYEYITTAFADENTKMEKTGRVFTPSGIIKDFLAQVEPGKTLKFGNKGEMLGAVVYGFSSDERTHVWNSGTRSKLVFQINDKNHMNDNIVLSFKFKYLLGSKQRIKCYVNGAFIEEKSVSTVDKPISFIIPANAIGDDGRVELEFEFPDAKPIGKARDNRTVAFAFDYMVVDYAQDVYSKVKVGNEALAIDFSRKGNSDILINEGWHSQEEKHRWASDLADIIFYTEVKQDYLISVNFLTYTNSGDTHVLLNDKEISVWGKNSNSHTESLVLPKELLNENGIQKIAFITDDAKSPFEAGTGSDKRILGIDVKQIIIAPHTESKIMRNNDKIGRDYIDVYEEAVFNFSRGGNSDDIIDEGWHSQEEKHRWASAIADIVFRTHTDRDYLLSVEYLTYKHSGDTHVLLNGKELEVWEKNSSMHTESVVLPKELLSENGIQKVAFMTKDAKSPQETGAGEDCRILGIDVKQITIIPKQ